MKNTHKLFFGLTILLLAAPVWYAFLLSQELTTIKPKPQFILPESNGQVTFAVDTDTFRYIVSDGVSVQLDTGQWQATLQTSKELYPHYSIEVRNDTLYLIKDPALPQYGDWALAHIRAPQINGVTVVNGGQIHVESVEPRFYSRHLTIRIGEGKIYLPVDTDALDLHYEGGGDAMLRGKAGRLNIQGHKSLGNLSAFNLKADSAFVRSRGQTSFQLHVNSYLEADLLNSYGDLVYLGRPVVEKKENVRGRVIDANRIVE